MVWNLKNKVVVVTGGAEGIGYEIADKYLESGAKITILLDINEAAGLQTVKNLITKYGKDKALFLKCDVTTDLETVSKKIFDSYVVDVLVNNAGMINDTMPKKTIDINVTGVIEWSFKFWERMRKDKGGNGGTVINLSSVYGLLTDQFFPVYQSSKFAVKAFTRSLGHRANYESSGVRVIALCPGFTRTNLTTKLTMWNSTQTREHDLEKLLKSSAWQEVDAVGTAAVEVYQRADSGTVWRIEGAAPVFEVLE